MPSRAAKTVPYWHAIRQKPSERNFSRASPLDPFEQLVVADRLVQRLQHAGARHARTELFAVRRHHDRGRLDVARAQELEKLEPAHARHVQIDEQAVGVFTRAEDFRRGGEGSHREAERLQQRAQGIANVVVIVDDMDDPRWESAHRSGSDQAVTQRLDDRRAAPGPI